MAKQQDSLKLIGHDEAVVIIYENHTAEIMVSRTRRNELDRQLNNPAAGPRAHLKSCKKNCANRIAIAAAAMIARNQAAPRFSAVPTTAIA